MHTLLTRASLTLAAVGGAALCLLIVMTCISVVGRATGIGAIFGDVELTEVGVAFAVFCFLPWCHLSGGHAVVDIFTSRMPARLVAVLSRLWAGVFAAAMVLIAVQLWAGMLSKFRSGQTSFLIEFPVWWAYAACLPGAVLAAVVAVHLATRKAPA